MEELARGTRPEEIQVQQVQVLAVVQVVSVVQVLLAHLDAFLGHQVVVVQHPDNQALLAELEPQVLQE